MEWGEIGEISSGGQTGPGENTVERGIKDLTVLLGVVFGLAGSRARVMTTSRLTADHNRRPWGCTTGVGEEEGYVAFSKKEVGPTKGGVPRVLNFVKKDGFA